MSEDDIESYWERPPASLDQAFQELIEETADIRSSSEDQRFASALIMSQTGVHPSYPEGATGAGQGNRFTAEEQREFNQRELIRILNALGINAGVREYTHEGIRSLYITFNGQPRLRGQPYNLSASPTSEEGLVISVQFE